MGIESNAGGTPQFQTAEYSAKPGGDRCRTCGTPISGSYFRVNGVVTCAGCSQKAEQSLPKDTHAAFVRGLAFGVGGAILGLILYAGFGIITGLVIGYVSLAVGYIVGKAIHFGSSGIGGRRYQIAAAVLTYAAVSMAAVPISISQYIKTHPSNHMARPATSENTGTDADRAPDGGVKKLNWPKAILGLIAIGLASPFLDFQDPIHGIIGLVILLVGIRIAWRLTAGASIQIIGPFQAAPLPPAANAAAVE